jgi:hypothetical protein
MARAVLPPADRGDLDRAIEIAIVKHTRGGADRDRASRWCYAAGLEILRSGARDWRTSDLSQVQSGIPMQITGELKCIIEAIEPGFFGVIEIGVQGEVFGVGRQPLAMG